ncbi:MAG TPA: STAS domain-containing protein [Solirubrobacteraceae bacterium]|jgi:anti-anti-sigma factor|nr:STAS domain-containing protein [Solirubrobacteraceae bacterium]
MSSPLQDALRGSGVPTPVSDELASVTRREEDGLIIAAVKGEIDASNATHVGRELGDLSNRALGLVVDLSAVDYLDSTGIALLYELHIRLARRGQSLAVVAPAGGAPRRVLELTAFDTRAPVMEDVDAAVRAVRSLSQDARLSQDDAA